MPIHPDLYPGPAEEASRMRQGTRACRSYCETEADSLVEKDTMLGAFVSTTASVTAASSVMTFGAALIGSCVPAFAASTFVASVVAAAAQVFHLRLRYAQKAHELKMCAIELADIELDLSGIRERER